MRVAPPTRRDLEAVADLDALHRLDAHERLAEHGVELAIPVHVAAEPDGHAVAEHFDDAAERVAVLRRGLDLVDHRSLGRSVEAAHRRLVDVREIGRSRTQLGLGPGRTHLQDVAYDLGTDRGQERLRQRAGRATRCGLTGAGSLEHVAGIVEAVLLHAREVGMAGPGLGERLRRLPRGRAHLFDPLRPLGVGDVDADRRTEGAAVADAA